MVTVAHLCSFTVSTTLLRGSGGPLDHRQLTKENRQSTSYRYDDGMEQVEGYELTDSEFGDSSSIY